MPRKCTREGARRLDVRDVRPREGLRDGEADALVPQQHLGSPAARYDENDEQNGRGRTRDHKEIKKTLRNIA